MEKQLYKLAKKGDLDALSALNDYYEKCVTEAKTPKESSKIRQKALKAALIRIIWAILACTGTGIIAYLACAIIMPD